MVCNAVLQIKWVLYKINLLIMKKIELPNNFFKEIEENTEFNNHIENYLYIAKVFNYSDYLKIFTGIKMIQDVEQCLPHDLAVYRNNVLENMMIKIEIEHGKELRDKIAFYL